MSDSKRETVDHWAFVDGVKSPLGRLADACLDAYEENGNPLLEEAANALRAIETVDRGNSRVHEHRTRPSDKERRLKPMSENTHIINDGPDADDISEVVIECVRNNCYSDMSAFKVAEITRESDLWDDLNFDCLDIVELIMDVEDKLSQLPPYHSVSIPEEMCDAIDTVGDLVDAACKVMGVRE